MPSRSSDDQEAKLRFIEAFFDEKTEQFSFLPRLASEGHEEEARLLACCYIEGLGNWLFNGQPSGAEAFVRALRTHGDESVLSLILPYWLTDSLPRRGSAGRQYEAVKAKLLQTVPDSEALEEADLISRAAAVLSSDELDYLRREVWRGTVANAVYADLRSMGVHWLGSPSSISFSESTFRAEPLPSIDFRTLHRALTRILDYARRISMETGKWFGHT